ncbi:cytochrome P450 [Mycena leptocephala]|nr:cytochrome P450 [Mycena leptocephala]
MHPLVNDCQNDAELPKKWREEFGPTFVFKNLFSLSIPAAALRQQEQGHHDWPRAFGCGSGKSSAAGEFPEVESILVLTVQQTEANSSDGTRRIKLSVSSQNPTMNQLNSLPYLDSVVREVLRVYSPVTFVDRMAMQDDVLPLSKPYIDKTGKLHDTLLYDTQGTDHSPPHSDHPHGPGDLGDDAAEFRPERWEHIPDASSAVPSVWGNLFTFFAGPNNCIGFRFALVEFKALLFTLVRAFEFEPAFPKGGIGCTSSDLQLPVVVGEREKGTGLPMLLKPYNA